MADDPTVPCVAGFLKHGPRDLLDEPELARVPDGVDLVDGHVHLFPPAVFGALWSWFDAHGWAIRYRLQAEEVSSFLAARGVRRFVALTYAHKPGMATFLNQFLLEIASRHPEIAPLAAVMPGEPGAKEIVRDALHRGARGVKLHCHVQRMPADDPRMMEVYEACDDAGGVVLVHAGREPNLAGYGLDTRALCGADQMERVLQRFPRLRVVVPHLGADEWDAYAALLDRHENLYLDTTMAIADYFQGGPPRSLFPGKASRLLYGTDFPNLPYAWSRELSRALTEPLTEEERHALFVGNAERLFFA